MSQAADKFVALNKKQAETAIRAIPIGFIVWETLIKLSLEASGSLSKEGIAALHAFPQTGDMTSSPAWTGPFRAGVDKLSGYSRNIYTRGGRASGELWELLAQTLHINAQEVYGLGR